MERSNEDLLIPDPTPGYLLVYDERWGGSPLLAAVVILAGGVLLAVLFVLAGESIRLISPEFTLGISRATFYRKLRRSDAA